MLTDNASARATTLAQSSKRLLILISCGVIVLAVDFGYFLSQAPQTAIFEQIICRNRGLHSRGVANATVNAVDPCKAESVQGELATILGYKDTFEVLPSMSSSNVYRCVICSLFVQVSCCHFRMAFYRTIGAGGRCCILPSSVWYSGRLGSDSSVGDRFLFRMCRAC